MEPFRVGDRLILLSEHSVALFEEKVERGSCWVWTARVAKNGYGMWSVRRGGKQVTLLAHRVAWYLAHGENPPAGTELDHLCRNRRCVNPEHLEPVSRRENLIRGETFAAVAVAKTECLRGHALAGYNLIVRPNGTRNCRTCHREATYASRRRKAAARG